MRPFVSVTPDCNEATNNKWGPSIKYQSGKYIGVSDNGAALI